MMLAAAALVFQDFEGQNLSNKWLEFILHIIIRLDHIIRLFLVVNGKMLLQLLKNSWDILLTKYISNVYFLFFISLLLCEWN